MPDSIQIQDRLRQVIADGLTASYTARSCKDDIETGNHYQSVQLGSEQTKGFRSGREPFLQQVDFTGRSVLDLGSNLGEISRAARARGARLVDGFEYDPFFLDLANTINAHNRETRVSFFLRDITDPTIYREPYDIVLAFSVFSYVHSVVREIAAITNAALVIETHRLTNNLETDYLATLLPHFPHYAMLGESDWGLNFDPGEKRAVIVFAKDPAALAAALVSSQR